MGASGSGARASAPRGSAGLSRLRGAEADDGWRLLVRIAQVRWVAIALGCSYAFASPLPLSARTSLLVPAALAASYNTTIVVRSRRSLGGAGVLTVVSVTGDFVWVTVAATVITLVQGQWSATIGYVTVGSECGLLLGWSGALGAIGGGGAALLANQLLNAHAHGGVLDLTATLYDVGTLVVAAAAAAVAASELHAQHRNLQAQAASLAEHARTDHLTGVGNAFAMEEAMAHLGARHFGLLLVDVDDMAWANHVYGHLSGDELLHSVARVLAATAEHDDLAARFAEDKFMLLLPGADRARTVETAERVRAATHAVAVSAGRLRVSIGCAWTTVATDPREVMMRADDALLAAKAAGGDRVEVQAPDDRPGRWRLRETVESIITDDRGVYSVYQRIVRLRDGGTAGWEALSRPQNWPTDTDVEALFITAHRMGRARDLDWRCRQRALWEAARIDGPLFVNVNAAALFDPLHGVDQMLLLCQWAGRSPHSVVLELSERDGMPDLNRLQDVLAQYRAAGFRFALDDLGEGQTSFELVLAARPEFFKLARPMVQSAARDVVAHSAVRALVGFAHDIGSTVIAEGIEDEATLELCIELEIDHGQGWLFGRPQPADRLPST